MDMTRDYSEQKLIELLGRDLTLRLKSKQHFCTYLDNGFCCLSFSYYDSTSTTIKADPVCFCCTADELIMVSDNAHCRSLYQQLSSKDAPHVQLIAFLHALLADDVDALEDLEDAITRLEDTLLQSLASTTSAAENIVALRRQLLRRKRYYEQLQSVIDSLLENPNDLLNDTLAHRYDLLSRRIEQLLNLVQTLQEAVAQAREVYQTQLATEQNNIMKIFTIITTIFMPLTLIVGWYGMNFTTMPELHWAHGYGYVITLSVLVCTGCAIVFKRNHWL